MTISDPDPNAQDASIPSSDAPKGVDEAVVHQFKIIVVIVLIILVVFLGFFIYNLIKCYLPKWRSRELVKEEGNEHTVNNRKIEFEEI
jgi:hypothetical protein